MLPQKHRFTAENAENAEGAEATFITQGFLRDLRDLCGEKSLFLRLYHA
jgi:hypothetical protein